MLQIAWAPAALPADDTEANQYLASADTSGFLVLFDVTIGKAKQRLSESNRVVNGR